MLDLGYVREHLDAIEQMARDRGITLDLAPFRKLDTERRHLITHAERLKAERNRASEEIARLKSYQGMGAGLAGGKVPAASPSSGASRSTHFSRE